MTAQEYQQILEWFGNTYILPFYQIIGGILAIAILALAYYVVIHPFTRRLRD